MLTFEYYFRHKGWQRFIVGLVLGMIIGWVFFFILNGLAQEKQINLIKQQQTKIKSLEDDKDIWQKEVKRENINLQKKLTVQDIQIDYANKENPRIGEAEQSELAKEVRDQLTPLLTQSIESVAANRELIYLIENKEYMIDKEPYRVKIQSLVIYSTIVIVLKINKVA